MILSATIKIIKEKTTLVENTLNMSGIIDYKKYFSLKAVCSDFSRLVIKHWGEELVYKNLQESGEKHRREYGYWTYTG